MLLTDGENSQADSEAYVAPLETDAAPVSQTETNSGAADQTAVTDIAAHEEAVAGARGWVPKETYRGDPAKWLPAKDFLDRNASLQKDVGELKTRLEDTQRQYMEKLERMERVTEKVVRQTREEAHKQLEIAKRAAVELGDTDAYDRLSQDEINLYDRYREEDKAIAAPATKQETQEVTLLPETATWIENNPWFNTNKALNSVALGFYEEAGERFKTEADKLKYVDERLAHVYPDRFADKAKKPTSGMPSLEGGSRMPGGAQVSTQLPPEARAAAERFIKKGIIKSVDEYAKMYFEDN